MKKPGTWHTGPSQSAPLNVTGRSRPIPGDHRCLSDSSGLYSFPANDLEWLKGYRLLYNMYNELTLNPRALAKTKDVGERHQGKPRGMPGREGSLGCHEGRTHCSSPSPHNPRAHSALSWFRRAMGEGRGARTVLSQMLPG